MTTDRTDKAWLWSRNWRSRNWYEFMNITILRIGGGQFQPQVTRDANLKLGHMMTITSTEALKLANWIKDNFE